MAASGKTRLQIVNAVLSRLRETEVATTSSTLYSTLIATLLNTVKTDIEQAWQWRDLRDTYTVTAVPNTTSYSMTNGGQNAQILDAWNTTTNVRLTRGTFADFNRKFFGATTVDTGDITHYLPTGLDSNFDLQIDVWPNPTSTNTLKVNIYVPQADPTADATVMLIPNQVLIEGMIAHALAERGDDNGMAVQAQLQFYRDILSSNVAAEGGHDPSEQDWNPV